MFPSRLYYVCLDGVTATDAGCVRGKVFNPSTKQCDIPANVEGRRPGCSLLSVAHKTFERGIRQMAAAQGS